MRVKITFQRKMQKIRSLSKKSITINKISIKIIPVLIITITFIVTLVVILITRHHEVDKNPHRSLVNYSSEKDAPFVQGCGVPDLAAPRANATFVILARNNELDDVISSMKTLERHFNQWYQYPYVFLNDVEFDEDFKNIVSSYTNAHVEFGVIPQNHWRFDNDETVEFKQAVERQGDNGVMYGSQKNYHSMCRFYSGFFHKHELVRKYEWYWRVEPDVEFFCDLTYDPFIEMEKHGKKYGFTIMIEELWETVPNLFRYTSAFLKKYQDNQSLKVSRKTSWPLFIKKHIDQFEYSKDFENRYSNLRDEKSIYDRFMELLKIQNVLKIAKKLGHDKDDDSKFKEDELRELILKANTMDKLPNLSGEDINGEEYNLYHFWSNFEIARVDLWDNPIYDEYFQYLESTGGFYKERWGDAPVHSLALGFLLNLEEIHYFRDIGYQHTTIAHCPVNGPNIESQLKYSKTENIKFKDDKFDKFWSYSDPIKPYGIGCRCRCPSNHKDIEDSNNDFLGQWFEMNSDGQKRENKVNIHRLERQARKNYRLGKS